MQRPVISCEYDADRSEVETCTVEIPVGTNLPEIATYQSGLSLVENVAPETGHISQIRAWNNPTAPIKKRVLAFANSFFERGGGPAGLSWWFATWFEDFKFVWSPELDPAEIEAYKPDIVICQTIERFMVQAPSR